MSRNQNIGSLLGKDKPALIYRPSPDLLLPDTHLGLEIEIEKVNMETLKKDLSPQLQGYWEWHEDPSLHDKGCEFTFRIPLFGEDVVQATKGLLEICNKKKWKVSPRTGIHVHLDARDLPFSQLLGLITYYICYEPAIYAWVGEGRDSNNFSLPWYKGERSVEDAFTILSGMRRYMDGEENYKGRIVHDCEHFHKYAGLNLKSLANYGSLEFRHLKTTLDWLEIKRWINVVLALKLQAIMAPESTMSILVGIRRRGILDSLSHTFGGEFVERIQKQKVLDVENLIRTIALPNAIELIGGLTQLPINEGQAHPLKWATGLGEPKVHRGFELWRKENFPKGKEPTEEEIKKLKANKLEERAIRAGRMPPVMPPPRLHPLEQLLHQVGQDTAPPEAFNNVPFNNTNNINIAAPIGHRGEEPIPGLNWFVAGVVPVPLEPEPGEDEVVHWEMPRWNYDERDPEEGSIGQDAQGNLHIFERGGWRHHRDVNEQRRRTESIQRDQNERLQNRERRTQHARLQNAQIQAGPVPAPALAGNIQAGGLAGNMQFVQDTGPFGPGMNIGLGGVAAGNQLVGDLGAWTLDDVLPPNDGIEA